MPREQKEITSLRLLCKALTGRTSATPIASINATLRKFEAEYIVEVKKFNKKTNYSPNSLIFAIKTDGEDRGSSLHTNLALPTSYRRVVEVIAELDGRAEIALGLNYGARGAQPE